MFLFSGDFLWGLFTVVMIDLVLAGDNAIVIGMAARNVPLEHRKKAIMFGMGGAILVRMIATVCVVWLLQIPGLLLAGGLMLLWIAYKLLADDQGNRKDHQRIGRIAVAGQPGDAPEDDGEHNHRQEWSNDGPQDADDGLLVSDRHVAPGQHVKKFPVAPQVAPIVALGAAGFDDEDFFRLHAVPLVIILSWPGAEQ